jgi:hypothetical protein
MLRRESAPASTPPARSQLHDALDDDTSILGTFARLFRFNGIPVGTFCAVEAFVLRPTREPLADVAPDAVIRFPAERRVGVRGAASRTRRRRRPRQRAS